jgi:hypothetical protein
VPRIGRPSEHQVVRGVGGLGDFLADDLFLADQVVGVHVRAQHQVGDHRGAEVEAVLQGADLEAGALVAGGGVEVAALRLDHLDEVTGGTSAGALEDHVLQQVRPAGTGLVLAARAAAGDDGKRDRLQPRHRITDDADAVGETVNPGGGRLRPRRRCGHRP